MSGPSQFKAAYLHSRFFHGENHQGPQDVQARGILTAGRSTYPGANDPYMRAKPNASGPIYLGLSYSAAQPYGSAGVVRVFLGIDRADYLRPPNLAKIHLSEASFQNRNIHEDTAVFGYVYRDSDAGEAVLTGTDINPNCVWGETLSALCALGDTSIKTQTIMANIRSFDDSLSAQTGELLDLMRRCVNERLIGDAISTDKDSNTIVQASINLTQRAEVRDPATGNRRRSGTCNCTII